MTSPRHSFVRCFAAALFASIAAAASAAPQTPVAPPLTGDWIIGRTSEWPDTCTIGLLKGETIGGFEVKLHRECKKSFAWTDDVTAWRLAAPDDLVLADALRHAVIHFRKDETGDWTGTGPDKQDYIIQPVRPAKAPPRKGG